MSHVRRSLYQRLPEIYRIKDNEHYPPGQLKAYLDVLDQVPAEMAADIEALYHDFFIETCADWAIPYIADLLGSSHLSGQAWTLRADVARTVHHRRRKGTLGAIESLTYALSGWAVHAVELRERLVWNQHLNHQRPDRGGTPPIPAGIEADGSIGGAVRGGTINLRDPALLSFYNGPFDPFAHLLDLKPGGHGAVRHNLPNLAIFLWRLQHYTVPVTKPVLYESSIVDLGSVDPGEARFALRYDLHPLAEPMVLFNTHRFRADAEPPDLSDADAVPGPMPRARLSEDTLTGNPRAYIGLEYYGTAPPAAPGENRAGLTLHLPEAFRPPDGGWQWRFRGANLCAWHNENALDPNLREHEIIVDPEHGRLLIGLGGANAAEQAEPLNEGLFVSATYGFSGTPAESTGAHPVVRELTPPTAVVIDYDSASSPPTPEGGSLALQEALNDVQTATATPLVIEINDSRIYDLDIQQVTGSSDEAGWTLNLGRPLWIRAASGQRPVIRLKKPLAFRPVDIAAPSVGGLDVTLEGLYITWDDASDDFGPDTPLIVRAALNRLNIDGCTLDPGSHKALDGTRQPPRYAFRLGNDYGFAEPADVDTFDQTPQVRLDRAIAGPMAIDSGYELHLAGTIVDAASGLHDAPAALAVHAVTDPEDKWGPALTVNGITCFGRMRVSSAEGQGGLWLHRLEVHDNQRGCIRFSRFSGDGDRLPQHHGCVFASEAELSFVSEIFGEPGYAQLHRRSHRKILEQGPDRDAMGAFGYLLNTHKWKNINIRYREYMPVGVRPLLIPVT